MMDDVWTVGRILEWIEGYLAKHDDDNARLSAQWLVADALSCSRMQLFLDLQRPLTNDERAKLRDFARRRATGEPLQYITGTVDFRHITIKVREGVLIPRPETEVLVSEALALLPPAPKPQDALDAEVIRKLAALERETAHQYGRAGSGPGNGTRPEHPIAAESTIAARSGIEPGDLGRSREDGPETLLVADLCTGTGCIACSIAYEHSRTRVFATDISPDAIALARENVASIGLEERIEVLECDLGSGIDTTLIGSFDLIVSNPPYVPTSVLGSMPREVTDFEPTLALDGGADGLDVFKRLVAWCAQALKPGGAFAFELHEGHLDSAAAFARESGFSDTQIITDLAGRPRILTGRK